MWLEGIPVAPKLSVVARLSPVAIEVPVRWIVVHATDNTASASAEASYAANRELDPNTTTSSHFYVDASGALASTPLDLVAWHAFREANHHGIAIEMCGISGQVPAATVANAASLVGRLSGVLGVPLVKLTPAQVGGVTQRGVCGHRDITLGLNTGGGHDDPGVGFDWPGFMAIAAGAPVPPSPPAGPGWPGYVWGLPAWCVRSGHGLTMWQQRLHDRGWPIGRGSFAYGAIDGVFGPKMDALTRDFQKDKASILGQPDGLLGKNTWDAAWSAPVT